MLTKLNDWYADRYGVRRWLHIDYRSESPRVIYYEPDLRSIDLRTTEPQEQTLKLPEGLEVIRLITHEYPGDYESGEFIGEAAVVQEIKRRQEMISELYGIIEHLKDEVDRLAQIE